MIESSPRMFAAPLRGTKVALVASACIFTVLAGAACGGGSAGGGQESSGSGPSSGDHRESAASGSGASGETTAAKEVDSEKAELARARVGEKEITNMIPADGQRPDKARPVPDNPPDGIEVYPATTNRSVKGPIHYDREPPTNGDHAPIWLNCGFYDKPVQNRFVVHSLDHGVVWITYRPGLPSEQIDKLRSYGKENYVIVSPYPGQDAPVIATSWRVQLELHGADDPRLHQFVDEFKISELAPLSGNRCVGGVGDPEIAPSG